MQLVLQYQDKITTTSVIIAERFEKQHLEVVNTILEMECSDDFRRDNFELSSQPGRDGKNQPIYFITKRGFIMLAMRFSGEKAYKFREAFIDAFEKMEKALFAAKTPVLIPTYQSRILSMPAKSCPANRWCVFDQASDIMLLIEKEVGSVSKYDLVDGSIGSYWSKFREGKPWAKMYSFYYHDFQDKRGVRQSKCYDYTELEHFKVWLHSVYKPTLLYGYLHSKFKSDHLMRPRVEAFKQKLLPQGKAA